MSIEILGFIAGALGIFASLPQIIKILKTKKTKDISLSMYIILDIASLLWLIYGIIGHQSSLIITNIIFQFLNTIIIVLKIKNG